MPTFTIQENLLLMNHFGCSNKLFPLNLTKRTGTYSWDNDLQQISFVLKMPQKWDENEIFDRNQEKFEKLADVK